MSNVEFKPGEKLQIHLMRPDQRTPWGFRLQGGIDFSTPLSIQTVNPNSVSEYCGLKPGDAILKINDANSDQMTHDEAKGEIVRSGNQIVMYIDRGAVKIWKPAVTPLSELRPQELNTIQTATGDQITPVQKTSLAINKANDEPCRIGSSHNRVAQPFGASKAAVPNIVHAQFNSPMSLYSADNIADTYSQQTQGIQTQMSGMDINERPLGTRLSGSGQILEQEEDAQGSPHSQPSPSSPTSPPPPPPSFAVPDTDTDTHYHHHQQHPDSEPSQFDHHIQNDVLEDDSNIDSPPPPPPPALSQHPSSSSPPPSPSSPSSSSPHSFQSAVYKEQTGDTPSYRGYTNPNAQSRTFSKLKEQMAAESEHNSPGFRPVSAPVAKPPSEKPQQQSMRCGGCDMLATGVIVRANGTPYHVACFKCASCSMNLKQKGFFVVNDKLYCEIHAKRQAQPPGSNMVATAVYR